MSNPSISVISYINDKITATKQDISSTELSIEFDKEEILKCKKRQKKIGEMIRSLFSNWGVERFEDCSWTQKDQISKLMRQSSNLGWTITSLNNGIYGKYLNIFNSCFDLLDYNNQLGLAKHFENNLT